MRKLSWMETGHPVRAAQIARDPEPRPFMCGGCGMRFASKTAKRHHKAKCAPDAAEVQAAADDEICDDADLYARVRIPPHIKALADAEWAAMNWKGELPKGWTPPNNSRPTGGEQGEGM